MPHAGQRSSFACLLWPCASHSVDLTTGCPEALGRSGWWGGEAWSWVHKGPLETKPGPAGVLGTKPFCVPHFFDSRKQPSFIPQHPSGVPMGRFKHLLAKKGGDVRPGRNQQWRAALGQGPVSPSMYMHNDVFELRCRYWNPFRWEQLAINDGMAAH